MEKRVIKMDDLGVEAVEQDKEFFLSMDFGETKAVVLNNVVVMLTRTYDNEGDGMVQAEISCVRSVRIDADLRQEDIEYD